MTTNSAKWGAETLRCPGDWVRIYYITASLDLSNLKYLCKRGQISCKGQIPGGVMGNPLKHWYKGWIPLSDHRQLHQVPAPWGRSLSPWLFLWKREDLVGQATCACSCAPLPYGAQASTSFSLSSFPHHSFHWRENLEFEGPSWP